MNWLDRQLAKLHMPSFFAGIACMVVLIGGIQVFVAYATGAFK